ncbi:cation:proton antiporter [Ningiella sp. W23]|uniref:cation:proton antiporter n=1 Tax=Ningiella sp. W23 TaxID=3023715 RepID=UPI0037584990
MHSHSVFIILAGLLLAFGLASKLSHRTLVSGPMVFVAAGALFGSLGLDVLELNITSEELKFVAEITLILILFVDASIIRFKTLGSVLGGIPSRLLGIGLPLSMVLGTLVAVWMFPNSSIWLLMLVALMLSPTDAALGQAVVNNEHVPQKIREGISVESGLNDGIALPPILLCMAVLSYGNSAIGHDGYWYGFLAMQLTIGPLVGAAVGIIGAKCIDWATHRNWMNATFHQISAIALSILAYSLAEAFSGNGFIAAFFAGLLFGSKHMGSKIPKVLTRSSEFGEAFGELLSLIVFFVFGAVALPHFLPFWDIKTIIYALLSLTLIRFIPVYISLIGTGIKPYTKCFIAWFGPRGIASVLYLLMVITELGLEQYDQALSIVVLTILISVFAHGVSAVPMSKRFAK